MNSVCLFIHFHAHKLYVFFSVQKLPHPFVLPKRKAFSDLGLSPAAGCVLAESHKLRAFAGTGPLTAEGDGPGTPGGEGGKLHVPACPACGHNAALSSSGSRGCASRARRRMPDAGRRSPDAGLDPAPGGGPSWAGKTTVPGMPCRGRACLRDGSRRGAGWFKTRI